MKYVKNKKKKCSDINLCKIKTKKDEKSTIPLCIYPNSSVELKRNESSQSITISCNGDKAIFQVDPEGVNFFFLFFGF